MFVEVDRMLKDFVAMLRGEFCGYNGQKLLKDLLAGLTVAAVALPLAFAFGVSSGATAASGLVTAIIAGLVIGALSGAYYQISGPTGAMAAIIVSIVAQYQLQGVFIATFMAGILLLLAGILRIGRLTAFIPVPVIVGFTSGISIIIALGQVDNLFGVQSEGLSVIERLLSYKELGFSPNIAALGIGLFVILFMVFYPRKWNAFVPSSLIAIIIATAIIILFDFDVPLVGAIPKTLLLEDRLLFSSIDFSTVSKLIGPAVSIAMLGMIESLLCGMSASRMTGISLRSNQELLAQGIGNIIIPVFGGLPATAAIARTSVAVSSGAKTRIAGLIHAVGLLVAMFLLSPVMSMVPLSALAGVLIVTAWRMNEWSSIRFIFSRRLRSSIAQFSVTMIATVIFDLSTAILIGVALGLVAFIVKSVAIDISVENVDFSRINRDELGLKNSWSVVYITGPMFFMTSDALKRSLKGLVDKKIVIFSLRGVPMADLTVCRDLIEFAKKVSARGGRVIFCSVQPGVMDSFERTGVVEAIGKEKFYFSVDLVLHQLLETQMHEQQQAQPQSRPQSKLRPARKTSTIPQRVPTS
jgi:SulP family sulfate permease